MKRRFKIFAAMGLAVTAMAWTSCDDDHKPDWSGENGNPAAPATMVSSSVAEGAVIAPSTGSIEITYSAPIAFNSSRPVTLNGDTLSIKANPDTGLDSIRVEGDKLVIDIPALKHSTAYKLVIDERTVAAIGAQEFTPAVTINFTTEARAPQAHVLCNPAATAQAVKLWDYLWEQRGKSIVSGAMANVNNNRDFAQWIAAKTGKTPALNCFDFIHLPESGQNWIDYSDISAAKAQWDEGGLVSYMWHWRVPTDEQAYRDGDYDRYGSYVPGDNADHPVDFDIDRALTEGTWEHEFLMADIAKVAAVLAKLQEAGIPVLWRPLHEAAGSYKYNGAWFWWGAKGGESTKKLWRLLYDQLVNVHGLNNLIWVWTAQYEPGYESNMAADYPGDDVVDVVGVDIYADNDDSQVAAYNALNAMVDGNKLVAVTETGRVQDPAKCLADGAAWSWFMIWYTYDIHTTGADTDGFGNTAESLTAVMNGSGVINLGDIPSLK